jgi:ParB family transcriptional regulator, chromosome partitioning protein
MSSKRGAWISRRGQADVEAAIDQVIDRQPQPGELVQQMVDALIEDSPYQARQTFNTDSVADLTQGMQEVGFQGVLIVRPHGDTAKRRRGIYQLVYGHRRRVAWRRVCAERDQPCLLPVVIREVSDAQLLTVGAQENLQRRDLDPVEEAQIVAWHERMFFDKNQAEIGAMLGKSSDWVSVRSRIHKLPEVLKERLRQRPRAIKQMLELAALHSNQPIVALAVADRVVDENLTVEAVRAIIREQHEHPRPTSIREGEHNRRAGATSVQDITIGPTNPIAPSDNNPSTGAGDQRLPTRTNGSPVLDAADDTASRNSQASQLLEEATEPRVDATGARDLLLLQEAASALALLASRPDALPRDAATGHALDQAQQALNVLQRMLLDD